MREVKWDSKHSGGFGLVNRLLIELAVTCVSTLAGEEPHGSFSELEKMPNIQLIPWGNNRNCAAAPSFKLDG